MREKRPLLTISLLSSGRAKTIRKCLDSLTSLMEKVDSELIIVDTGCDEEVKKLMSEYTDQFIPFVWCDDFSAARNAGLKKAKGEWFLYIDDDEWFLDTKEIEEFFLSGEYRKYRCAFYIQRNYLTRDRQLYTDAWVSRIVCLEKGVHFESCIHEYLHPLYEPGKLLHSTVEHFGYIYDSAEEERKHIERNTKLLLKMIEKEKDDIRWWVHLLNEYFTAKEYHQMQELCHEGLEYFGAGNDEKVNLHRGALYCGLVEAEMLSDCEEQAIRDTQEALKDGRNTQVCRMRLYGLGAELFYSGKKYNEAVTYFKHYMKYYDLLKDDENKRLKQETFFSMKAFGPSGKNGAVRAGILSALQLGDASVLKKYFREFGWNDVMMPYWGFIGELVDAMSRLPYDQEFVPMAQTMADRKEFGEQWDGIMALSADDTEDPDGDNMERFYRLARIFSQVDASNHYVWYLKILYGDHAGELEDPEAYFEKLFHYVADIFQLDDKIFEIAQKYHVNLGDQFEKIPFEQWKVGVDAFFSNSSHDKIMERTEMVRNTVPVDTDNVSAKLAVRYDYFFMKTAETEIICGSGEENLETLQGYLETFCEQCLAFYKQIYRDNTFEGEMELLPALCRAAVELKRAMDSEEISEVTDHLKNAISYYPPFADTMKQYAGLYGARKSEQLKRQAEAQVSPEMRQLAGQLKEKVRVMLEQGMQAEAYATIMQMKVLLPGDKELLELEELCLV